MGARQRDYTMRARHGQMNGGSGIARQASGLPYGRKTSRTQRLGHLRVGRRDEREPSAGVQRWRPVAISRSIYACSARAARPRVSCSQRGAKLFVSACLVSSQAAR